MTPLAKPVGEVGLQILDGRHPRSDARPALVREDDELGALTVAAGTVTTASGAAGHRQLSRVTGVAGSRRWSCLFVPAIAHSGQEPGFTGTREDILAFFSSMDSPLAAFGEACERGRALGVRPP